MSKKSRIEELRLERIRLESEWDREDENPLGLVKQTEISFRLESLNKELKELECPTPVRRNRIPIEVLYIQRATRWIEAATKEEAVAKLRAEDPSVRLGPGSASQWRYEDYKG